VHTAKHILVRERVNEIPYTRAYALDYFIIRV